ncbi:hypothetical protein TYRP_021740 [Tyrophagus putrescentiae]|nr:hypothetical protein TYRP_021740 [Tyrophagus putrescentiae]
MRKTGGEDGRQKRQAQGLISAKLKLAAFYEMACCSSDQFHFRMGHLGKITRQTLFEFALFYTGMVLYVAMMVMPYCLQTHSRWACNERRKRV